MPPEHMRFQDSSLRDKGQTHLIRITVCAVGQDRNFRSAFFNNEIHAVPLEILLSLTLLIREPACRSGFGNRRRERPWSQRGYTR